jgi:hypothetical protein
MHAAEPKSTSRRKRYWKSLAKGLEKRRQPARLDESVAVQKAQDPPTAEFRALVRSSAEAAVHLVAKGNRTLDALLDPVRRVVGRSVVDQHQLETRIRVGGESADRTHRDLPAAVQDHHHRDERIVDPRQRDLGQGFRRPASLIAARSGAV